jgi:hypothetical protein
MFDRIEKKKISGELKSKYFSILEWLQNTIDQKLKMLESESFDVLGDVLNEVE